MQIEILVVRYATEYSKLDRAPDQHVTDRIHAKLEEIMAQIREACRAQK